MTDEVVPGTLSDQSLIEKIEEVLEAIKTNTARCYTSLVERLKRELQALVKEGRKRKLELPPGVVGALA